MTFTGLLIAVLLILLVIVVLAQLSKVVDLLRDLVENKGKAEEQYSGLIATLFLIVGIVGIGLLVASYYDSADKFLPISASELGRDWNKYFQIYSIPIVVIFFVTHGLLFLFSYQYRYKVGRKVKYFAESNKLEFIWTSIPFVVLVALGLATTGKWIKATSKPGDDALHIQVTGMQFKWFVAYPGADNEFGARNIRKFGELQNLLGLDPNDTKGYDDLYTEEVVIPVNREIAFNITALDVIHDWYLPHFRVKMDAIPGVPTRLKITPDKTTEEMRDITGNPNFNYEVACAELCGSGHWNMRRVLKVVSEEEYRVWLSNQMTAKELYYDNLLAEQAKNKKEVIETKVEKNVHSSKDDHSTASL